MAKLKKGTSEWAEYQKRVRESAKHDRKSLVPDLKWREREERKLAAREFVERELNRDHEVTPMEALVEAAENSGNVRTAKVLGALQMLEAAAGANAAGGRGGQARTKAFGPGVESVLAKHFGYFGLVDGDPFGAPPVRDHEEPRRATVPRKKNLGTPVAKKPEGKPKPGSTAPTKPVGNGETPNSGVWTTFGEMDPMEYLPDLLGQEIPPDSHIRHIYDAFPDGLPPIIDATLDINDFSVRPRDSHPFWKWADDIKARFGEDTAKLAVDYLTKKRSSILNFFYGTDPNVRDNIRQYGVARKMMNDILEPYEIIGSGSSGISVDGTISRKSAVLHDQDIAAYIRGASRRTDWTSPEAQAASTAALMDNANIENAPVIQKLRKLYPSLRDAKFRYATEDWEWSSNSPKGSQYVEGVFTVPLTGVGKSESGRTSRLVTTMINGNPVDIMLSDNLLSVSKNDPRFGSAESAMDWKRGYANGKTWTKRWRQKDGPDHILYKPYGPYNPVINEYTGRTQFSPYSFADTLVDENGLPYVHPVETFPGSGRFIPAMMNTKGVILPLLTDDKFLPSYAERQGNPVLDYYSTTHPINNPEYANTRATRDDKPLVAIRGVAPGAHEDGKLSEIGPSIGVYPGRDVEGLVDQIMAGKGWLRDDKDIIVYSRADIDPQFDTRNMLFDEDAYTKYIYPRMRKFAGTAFGPAAALKYAAMSHSPVTDNFHNYPSIGNAYRNKIYERNPYGIIYKDEGYGEAKPYKDQDGRVIITAAERRRDPEGSKRKLLEALHKYRFAFPLVGGAGALGQGTEDTEDTEVQQAAKGGDVDGARESTAPTDEQVYEAIEFLHTVLEIGAPQNEWEQSMVQWMIDELEKRRPGETPRPEASTDGEADEVAKTN